MQSSNIETLDRPPARPQGWALTVTEWLMVLPASAFAVAVVARLLHPSTGVPARVGWAIFEWTVTHLTRPEAAIIFLALPGAALAAGSAALAKLWLGERTFREDVTAAFAIMRRQFQPLCLAAGTLLAAALLALAVHQMIVG